MTDLCRLDACDHSVAVDVDGLPYGYCPQHLPIVASAYETPITGASA